MTNRDPFSGRHPQAQDVDRTPRSERGPVLTGLRPISRATHNQSSNNPGQIETIAERRFRIFELRKKGYTHQQIHDDTGYSMALIANDIKAVMMGYREFMLKDAEDLVQLELERLDSIQASYWDACTGGNPQAAQIVLSCIRQRSQMLGLNAGVKALKGNKPDLAAPTQIVYVNDWRGAREGTPEAGEQVIEVIPAVTDDGDLE